MNNVWTITIEEFLPIYEEAILLGIKRGKKVGDNIEKEFFEILKKYNKENKLKYLGKTKQDSDLLTGNLREKGLKILNINEINRKLEK